MRFQRIAWTVARVLFGLFFIASTVMIMMFFGGNHPPEAIASADRLTAAFNESGFINPLLIAIFLIGGAAVLFDRSAPIGLLLLAPPVAIIAGFHWFLTSSFVWGSIWPLWLAALAWHYRHVYARLWERR